MNEGAHKTPLLIQRLVRIASTDRKFFPAKLQKWIVFLFQNLIRIDLSLHNRLHIDKSDLERLRNLPLGNGVIITPNHCDETDFKICVELSRIAQRDFYYMMNSEAFKEGFGIAGFWLQRLGAFSVDRGGDRSSIEQSKRYAIDLVKRGQDVLVIFPEGEIYYLNDLVQPLKSGAVDVSMKALVEMQSARPEFTVCLVPIAIKYIYSESIAQALEKRVQGLERHLKRRVRTQNLQMRLALIIAELLHRQEYLHRLKSGSSRLTELTDRIQEVRQSIIEQLEEKYPGAVSAPQTQGLLERSWKLSSYIRSLPKGIFSAESLLQIKEDLASLMRVGRMAGWNPKYVELNPSQERLAETVLNLEREVFQIHRPHQLARREVLVRIAEPIDLKPFMGEYQKDRHLVRRQITEDLRRSLQLMINSMDASAPTGSGAH
ncbi:MAG: 1-acyl-sn-glycerol-3-phosphate acyltransferase [Candidatus Obscuribacterales bacterium]|nr:1-acyl-sn-glycerol-3-phosphate acyltransferase [Candidatus Obscuribacterales bacterium]